MKIVRDKTNDFTEYNTITQHAHHFKNAFREKRIVIPRRRYQTRYTNVTPPHGIFWNVVKAPASVHVLGKQGWRGCRGGRLENLFPELPSCVLLTPSPSLSLLRSSNNLASTLLAYVSKVTRGKSLCQRTQHLKRHKSRNVTLCATRFDSVLHR